jgi:hypothetical protein
VSPINWAGWHRAYDDPASPLHGRLRIVQAHVRAALDDAPPGLRGSAVDVTDRYAVGRHRHSGVPAPLDQTARLFTAFRS